MTDWPATDIRRHFPDAVLHAAEEHARRTRGRIISVHFDGFRDRFTVKVFVPGIGCFNRRDVLHFDGRGNRLE